MSDFAQFLELVVTAYSPNVAIPNEVRVEAYQRVEAVREENPFQFLAALLAILQSSEITEHLIKQICFVLSYKTIERLESPDPVMAREVYIHGQCADLLTQFLSVCSAFFGIFPKDVAPLFSAISGVLMVATDSAVVEMLLDQISGMDDYGFLVGAFMAIAEIVHDYYIGEAEYPMLMESCFQLMQSDVPMELKAQIMKVICNMVDKLDLVFQNEANIASVQQLLMYAVQTLELKVPAYETITRIVKYHFQVFGQIASEVMELAAADLSTGNADIATSICRLLSKITDVEKDMEEKVIIPTVFPTMFPMLVGIFVTHGNPEPWEAGEYNVYIAIIEVLNYVIAVFWEGFAPAMMEFIGENSASESAELRELTVHVMAVLASIPQFVEANIEGIAGFAAEKLQDPSVRVREAAITVISEFASDNEAVKAALEQLLPVVIEHLGEDYPQVVICALECLSMMAELYVIPSFHDLFKILVPFMLHENAAVAGMAANVLSTGALYVRVLDTLVAAWPDMIELLASSCTDPGVKKYQENIIRLFDNCCEMLKGFPAIPAAMPQIVPMLLQDYLNCREKSLILALACFAVSDRHAYQEFLDPTMEIALDVINQAALCGEAYLETCCEALTSIWKGGVPIESYIEPLVGAMMALVEANPGNMRLFACIVEFSTEILKSENHEIRKGVYPVIRPILGHIDAMVEILPEAIDRENAQSLACASMEFLLWFIHENVSDIVQMPDSYMPPLMRSIQSSLLVWDKCDDGPKSTEWDRNTMLRIEDDIQEIMGSFVDLESELESEIMKEFITTDELPQRFISYVMSRGDLSVNNKLNTNVLEKIGLKELVDQEIE